jgi:hypothetical protein
MKSKKGFIILISVVAVIIAGALLSRFVNWPVDTSETSGDIAKASRFSRQTAAESLSNLEELIRSDEDYKNAVVVSYVVMQTRAEQFGTLVDLSNEVAGEIPAFADVLGKMNEARELAANACASLLQAGESLEAILGGESRPEMGQQTNNAALAYTALQKQNDLATRFIDTADKYLAANEGSDPLKLVRDQWVGYQRMTASLEGDDKLEQKMAGKEVLLTPEQSALALKMFNLKDTPVMAFTGQDSFTGLGAFSFSHQQYTMLSMPLVVQSFDTVILGLVEINNGISEVAGITDNVLSHRTGEMIQGMASGDFGAEATVSPIYR